MATNTRQESHPSPRGGRLVGLDVARGLAIFGMIVVHFLLVMQAEGVEFDALSLFDGRPTALFMLLAGMGLALMTQRFAGPELRQIAVKRGLFLLVLGFINLILWPGDILRIYGVIFLMAAWLAALSSRTLLALTAAFMVGFMVLLMVIDYGQNWDWQTLTYHRLWTFEGALRNLLVDGFRSVFPWAGVLILGMVLGRQPLRSAKFHRSLVAGGAALWLGAELVSRLLLGVLAEQQWVMEDPQLQTDVEALFGTSSMPPQLIFLGSALGFAAVVIGCCLLALSRWPQWLPLRALAATGQMAFTWYLGHLFFGVYIVYESGLRTANQATALLTAIAYFLVIAMLSLWWRASGRKGPMERLLRWVSG